jgi:hypothetical protein
LALTALWLTPALPLRAATFTDVLPTDWAYQALVDLQDRYGCVGPGRGGPRFGGGRSITRFEAAALLNACLERVGTVTDELRRLSTDFAAELAQLRGRTGALDAQVAVLEAQQFSTTTKLQGEASMVLAAPQFLGTAAAQVAQNRQSYGGTTFNYDLRLKLDTSFSGRDLLRIDLRSGNFDNNDSTFAGALTPTPLSELQVAFQQQAGADFPNVLGLYKLYYQTPLGSGFSAVIGPRVGQQEVLPLWPTAYSGEVLHLFNMNGAPMAYNQQIGGGGGLWWNHKGFSIGTYYISPDAQLGNPSTGGGIGVADNESIGGVQIGYSGDGWGIAALYNYVMNDDDIVTATPFVIEQLDDSLGYTNAFALSAYWQPRQSGWIPSISAGWGYNAAAFRLGTAATLRASQSWMVGLQWNDALAPGNAFGMAVGQPVFATALAAGQVPNDGNYAWEWWYRLRINDSLSLTPGLFYLSRPLGSTTPAGQTFSQLAGVLKLTLRF